MRYRTRADNNQTEISAALRAVGASVVSLGNVGKGIPDIMVGYRGRTFLLETKNPDRKGSYSVAARANLMRTPDQTKFHAEWRGGPLVTVFTVNEALRAIGAISGAKGESACEVEVEIL